MATLEVHQGPGRVTRVEIARDQTVLFGSSPKCDLVLSDPEVLPFHGRLRWKKDRLKVDASPEARFVALNGHKMASASFRQGDEIQVGSCRIFLIDAETERPRPARRLQDDKTRVQAPPFTGATASEPRSKRDPGPAAPASPPPGRGDRPNLEQADWLQVLEMAPPSQELDVPEAAAPLLERGESRKHPRPDRAMSRSGHGWWALIRALRASDRPPGEERILSSPLVVGLVLALVVLSLLSVSLWGIIQGTIASRLYNQAVESLNNGDYRNALRRYDEFLERYPKDKRAGKARVLRALTDVRQFTTMPGASWSNALEAERAMVRTVSREESYRDSKIELAELVLKTAEGLADRARGSADPRVLAEAEAAVALHSQVAGEAAEAFLARSRVPARLAEARATVRKAADRSRALAQMDDALKAGSSTGVYQARDALVSRYPDLADDHALIERMTGANDLIRRAVKVDPSRRPAETEPRVEPLGPPTSLVLRLPPTDPASPSPPGAIVFAQADGFAYGLDGLTGAPLWQRPVGLSSPFPPQPIPGGTTALVFDARHGELIRVDSRTGALVWRQAIGEPISDPPLVLGNQVIQAVPAGNLLLIDLATGEVQATLYLGMPLARTPISDEAGQFLYVLADQDCLFVLTRDPLACAAVAYLGHAPGSVASPPVRRGRFLVIAENVSVSDSRWRVFLIEGDGTRVRPVQQIAVPGWTWDPPATSGSVIWATGDRGSASAYAIGTYEAKAPFRLIAQTNPEPTASGPAFALARSENEILVASGRSARLDLDAEHSKINAAWTLPNAGPALAPPQRFGDLVVLTQQHNEEAGVALWCVDTRSGSVAWRTVLGSDWRVAPLATLTGVDEALTTLTVEGRALALSGERLAAGGFVEAAIPKPGGRRLPDGRLDRLEADSLTVLIPDGAADHVLVRTGPESESGLAEFRRVELPGPIGARPLLWGDDLLVPGTDGRVDLLDPRTGAPRAEPFLAPFDRANPTRWRPPVALEGDAVALLDGSGRVRRLTRASSPPARLEVSAEANLDVEIASEPLSTGGALIVLTKDQRIRALAARDFSPVGAWPLEAPLAIPPVTVAGRGFLADNAGHVHAFDHDGQRVWSITLRDGVPAGRPVVLGDSVWFLGRDGSLQRHALADGAPLDREPLDVLPAGDLQAVGSQLVIPAGLGTFQTWRGDR